MNLTSRGFRVLAALVFLASAGLLFADPLLFVLAAAVAVFLVYDLLDLASLSRKDGVYSFEPAAVEASVLRGNSRHFGLTLSTKRSISIDTSAKWSRFDNTRFAPGASLVGLDLSSDFAGRFVTDGAAAHLSSRYGLFSSPVVIPLRLSLRVYPRLIAAALAALEYLTRVGAGEEGEVEKNTLGPGMEYAETREYLPGDSLRRIDWKATARSNSLMVEHYFIEGGGALHIIYFVDAPGERTHDEMATQLLDLVVSSAVRVTPVSVTAYEKGARLTTFAGKGPEVVVSTLNLVLASSGVSYDDLYSLLDIVSVSKERRALMLAGRARLVELLRSAGGKRQALVSDVRSVISSLASPDVTSSFVILSSLVSNRDVLAEVVEDLRYWRAETTLVYPKRPWLDASGLAEAYALQSSQERMLAYAVGSGCLLGSIPLKLPRMTGIPSWAVSAAA